MYPFYRTQETLFRFFNLFFVYFFLSFFFDDSDADAVNLIDIGGVTLIRAAAKNFAHVVVLSHPTQYETFMERYQKQQIDMGLNIFFVKKNVTFFVI